MYIRLAGFVVMTTLLSALLVACNGIATPTPQQVPPPEVEASPQLKDASSVAVWTHTGTSQEAEALRQILENFRAGHAGVQVALVELPEDTYSEQVHAAVYEASIVGGLPCLLEFDGPNTYNYVWKDILLPLDGYVSPEMKADFLPSIIAQGTFQDGKLYSLGQFDSGLAIWANKTYLVKAGVRLPTVDKPWSREEFEAALANLQALPEVEYALDMKMNYGLGEWFTYGFSPILQSFGADLIDRIDYQSADGVLNGPQAVAALEMVQNWFKQGYVNPAPADDDDFVNGKAALSWVGHWTASPYQEALGDNLLLLPMPDFGNGPKTGMGSWNWGITNACKNPGAAWEVLKFILEPDQILLMTNANGAVPARRSALAKSELFGPAGPLRLYIQQNEAGFTVPRPITPAYPAITKAFAEAFNNIAQGADVKSQLDQAVQKIDQDIKDNRGYPLSFDK
ncbi:MAG: sugar ABC transporter substrate-binding protein [Anaerolineales bacterium]|nr:sugar ABC transporter substrate-binding protein [Anaerolineales bacterium]